MAFVGQFTGFADQRLELRAKFLRFLHGRFLVTPRLAEVCALGGEL